jgi:hypothetical protein
MANELEEFNQEFLQEVRLTANAGEQWQQEAFFDHFGRHLVDAGELETADRLHYEGARGIRVDGYGGDPVTTDGVLSLIICDFEASPTLTTLTATDMRALFRRLTSFLDQALKPDFRASLEESSPGFKLADLIAARWSGTTRVRLFLITNKVLSARVDGMVEGELEGIAVSHNVWDISRLHRFVTSPFGREEMEIDLEEYGGPIAVLPAHPPGAEYEAYLAVVPGPQLAAIYDRWHARLLEQNVRVFLQARGSVNKGIRNTIDQEPAMFLAYNNGITATAESLTLDESNGTLKITSMKNFQIVNGGQTTASIHAASRTKNANLSSVFVQMKLSVVKPSDSIRVVPKISEYANSQNKVSAADFFSNHPFHVRMEEFSRRLFAPAADGSFRQSKWFYERARGQYQDARAKGSGAAQKRFELEYPKKQVFSKTDLAKYLNVWRARPHIVSRGAQKNFVEFADLVENEWERTKDTFNEMYFRHAIAKAILFEETAKLVEQQAWYHGGYRANVVAYTLAKLARDTEAMGLMVDFDRVWRAQAMTDGLRAAIEAIAARVNDVIVATDENVTEWAKREACWTRVSELRIGSEEGWKADMITHEEHALRSRGERSSQKQLNGIQAQTAVLNAGAPFWGEVRAWANAVGLVSPKEDKLLEVASKMPSLLPDDRQSLALLALLRRLHAEGCGLGRDLIEGQ